MEWLFIAAISIGLPLAVPHALRARLQPPTTDAADTDAADTDEPRRRRRSPWSNEAFAGIALLAAGLIGLTLVGFDTSTAITLIAALTLGLAAGVVHPDLFDWLRPRPADDAVVGAPD